MTNKSILTVYCLDSKCLPKFNLKNIEHKF